MPGSFPLRDGGPPLTRRDVIRRAAWSAAACALIPAHRAHAARSRPVALPSIDTPADALRELADGNRRFVEGRALGPHRTLARVRDVSSKQTPFAAILACADSRLPVEILFDQGVGDLFVCRAAGNVVTPELLASLEFGTAVLGAKALVVVGHTSCGAVKAAVDGGSVPGQISALYQHIQPAVDRVSAGAATPNVDAVARENVRLQVGLIARSSPLIAGLVKSGALVVSGGLYELTTGRVTVVDA